MKSIVIALLLVTACKEQPKPARESSPRTDACTAALATFDRFVDTGEPNASPDRAKIKAALIERCIQDGWSDDAIACMKKAGTSHDVFACWNKLLGKEQRDAASKALGGLAGSGDR